MSEQMERNAYQQLLEGITFYIDKVVSDNKEKTTTARIVSVQADGSYTIDLEGKQYSNINTIGGTCTVNEMVKVMIPQGQYNNMFILKGGSGSGGGSASGVTSVNGKAGNVTLTASDVGALPNTTIIPTKTSELDNNSGFVVDTNYVHTDNNFTTILKDKLNGIANGAEVNVQANWNETDVNSDAYIKNKPSIPTKTSELQNDSNYVIDKNYVHTDNNYTNADKTSVGTIKDKVDKVEGKGLSTNDLTDALKKQYDEAVVDKHTHTNKQILDEITAPYTEEEKTKLESIEDGAQKNTVTGVKGSSETVYRTGNINITKENIGLSNVDNVKQWSNDNHPTTLSGYGITDGVDSTDFNTLKGRVDTNEDNIAMLDSDIEGLNTDVETLKTDVTTVKNAVTTIQDDYVPKSRKINGKALSSDIMLDASDVKAISTSQKGVANGVAELDANGLIPSSQLPSYVDDVLEYDTKTDFPTTGESGKIYIATNTNLQYRWTGTQYVEISPSLALGETSSTAYRGDRGKIAYDHSQKTSGNPHKVTKSDVGLGNVGNFKAVSTVASQGLTDTEKANARANIGAGTSNFSGSYNDLSDTPAFLTGGSQTTTSTADGGTNTFTFTKSDGTKATFNVKNGSKGSSGKDGTNGKDGVRGNTWRVGTDLTHAGDTATTTKFTSANTIIGDMYLNTQWQFVYQCIAVTSTNSTWEYLCSIKGGTLAWNSRNVNVASAKQITKSEVDGGENVYRFTLFDGSTSDLVIRNGTGVNITTTSIMYQANTSGTAIPTGTWSTTIPSVTKGQYLWSRTIVSYSDGKSTTTYNVAYQGKDGTNGTNGVSAGFGTPTATIDSNTGTPSVAVTATGSDTSKVFNFAFKNLKGKDGTNGKDGVRGNTWRVGTDLTHAGDTATTTKFTSANTIIGDMYLNTQWQFVYQCIAVTSTNSTWEYLCSIKGGTLAWNSRNVNVASAKQITKSEVDGGENVYRFTLFDGSTSDLVIRNGTGVNITTTSIMYQANTSGTAIPTGTWSTTIPSVTKGQYLWSRTIVSYSDGKSTTTYNVAYQGKDGTNGTNGVSAGFGTPTATIDSNTGTPSVAVTATGSDTSKVFNFAFKNLKGKDGTSAGFGTPTASVDANVGTPSVTVTASGSDTAKVFNFAFKNLKGITGATGTRGSVINYGTTITGTSTTATAFPNSGLASSLVNDMYINTSTFYLYRCTVAGNATNAKWVYVGTIKGEKGDKGSTGANGKDGITPTIKAASGSNISSVGTPSVSASTSGTETTFTFNYLKGQKGDNGKGINSTAVTYQTSSSGTAIPTGTWSITIPSVGAGQYLWTRVIITYTDSTTSTMYSVGRNGTNGSTPTIKAAGGTDIGAVGTPSVTSSTSGTTTTFTFHNLKGEKGEKGENATTTAVATESTNGLMSSADKTKLNNTNVVFGTCSTAAATAAKTVTITGNTNWQLKAGAIVFVKFTTTNTASNCTLNVNGTGAKQIWYNNAKYTGNSNLVCGYANRYIIFGYDGTYWVWLGFSAENNTWTAFKGATATTNGTAGYVPAPTKGNQDKFFRADGTWATLSLTWNE